MSISRIAVAIFVCSGALCAGSRKELEELKNRVAELEKENRRILQLLEQLQAKVADPAVTQPPASAVAARASAAPIPALAQGAAPSRAPKAATPGSHLKFYGWLRMDADIDSQRPNNGETPLFIASPGSHANDQGLLSLHPRLTRFGLDLNGPQLEELGGARLAGKLETDFENGGSDSRQIIRIRQAYFQLQWGSTFSVLGGQTWDVFSPLIPTVNNDTLMWNAGNLGDRRPQFRADWQRRVGRNTLSVSGAAGLTGAIDGLNIAGDGYLDGQESGRPDLQSRVGYSRQAFGRELGFGVSTFSGWTNTSTLIAGRGAFRAQGTNVDFTLPFDGRVAVRGEGWWGRNLSDVRGGAGQGLNRTTGREIRARGGWSELGVRLSRYWSIYPGFTVDDPVDGDVPTGGRTRNGAFYFANRFTIGPFFTIGADYLRWKTDYKALTAGIDNRVNLFFYYAF